jgi:CelD/BcsL family acetyltransferase involved in cellulose biosynthesis
VQPSVEYRLLRTTGDLSSFVPAWRRLWERDPRAMPFQSPEWLLHWWGQFGNDELSAVVIELQGEAIGFLPFYVYRDTTKRKGQLLPLGVGTTDYLDGVFAPECSIEEISGAIEELRRRIKHNVFCATQLSEHSRLLEAMRCGTESGGQESVSSGRGASISQSEGCSRMAAVVMAELPQKIRRNAMYYRNRAERCGRLELMQAVESNWEEFFEELRRLHALRWQTRGEGGVLADECVVRWHREAMPLLLRAGLLRLMALKLNDQVIAVLYSLIDPARDRRTQYFYITAYSPEYADLRPGTLLIAYAVERAAQEGVAIIDMLRGDEGYKQIWHMEKVPTFSVTLRASTRAAEQRDEESAA